MPSREGLAGNPTDGQQRHQESHHRKRRFHRSEEPEGAPQHRAVHQPALDRWAVEQVAARGLGPERDCREGVGAEIEGEDLQDTERERELAAGEGPDEERRELGDVVGQVVGQEPADVDKGRPSLLDPGDDAGEGVVEEHQVRRLTGDVGPRASHGDADVGLVQGGGVVDSVAGHRDDVTSRTQGPRDAEFVLGRDPGDDQTVVVEEGGQDALVGGEVGTGQHRRVGPAQPYLVGDGRGRRRMVTGHHRHADAGPPAAREGLGDVVARRVLQGDQTQQVQISLGRPRGCAAYGQQRAAAMASTLSPRAVRESTLAWAAAPSPHSGRTPSGPP